MRFKHPILTLTFLLLSWATVQAQFPCFSGVTITANGQDSIDLCQSGQSTISFDASIGALPIGYIVVDENDIIVSIGLKSNIDFSGLPGNNFRVYAFNFIGSITAGVGDPLSTPLANGCFALTSNFITVSGDAPSAGMVSTEDGETEAYTCPGDGLADLIRFDSTGAAGASSYTYLVTDENNVIVAIPTSDEVDFESFGTGVSRVWGLAYTGNLQAMAGDTASTAILASGCYALSGNFVTVFQEEPEAGSVSTEDGSVDVSVCAGDGLADLIRFDSMGAGNSAYTYVVTDTNNVILAFPDADFVDFDSAGAGICRVWGLAYTGNLIAMVGDTASQVALSDGCFDLSDNYILVDRLGANGGMVSTEDGATEVYTCPGDGVPDVVRFDSTGVNGDSFTYLVTDTNNVILAVPPADSADFDSAGVGTCRVWGLAYSGNLIAMVGDTASLGGLADGCFALSSNFITVYREQPDGGAVSTEDSLAVAYTCPGDGIPDIVRFDSTGASNSLYTYVITDTNNVILGLPMGDQADFDSAGVGACRVWGLAYTGMITAMVGDTASAIDLSDGCFDLSDNFITVFREQPDGGTVSTEAGDTVAYTCPGDGIPDIVRFDSAGASNGLYTYVITDTNNVILGLPMGDQADFDSAGVGACRVWGLAYTGMITAMVGDTASAVDLSDGCFDLSDNFITVFREQPTGGTVSIEMGGTDTTVCVGDGLADLIRFDSSGVGNNAFAYVVTDTNNVILALPPGDAADFEDAGGGVCRVWGLAYTGTVTAMVGDTASAAALSDGCFALSSNFITVIREAISGGTISTATGMDTLVTCQGDSLPDLIMLDTVGVSGASFTYLITDTSNVIQEFTNGDSLDLEGASPGLIRIWGLAYNGALLAMVGDTASSAILSDDCFALSSNFILVTIATVEGGMVATESGDSIVTICVGDGLADLIRFDSLGTGNSPYSYVVTDTNNVILSLPSGDSVEFENAGVGTCRVWGLAYTGSITAMVGDTASLLPLSDGCFSLSSNYVTINRETVEGGTVSTENGMDEVYTCPGDGIADIVRFDSAGVSNVNFTYVVTDTNNVILGVPGSDQVDFDSAGVGTCRVWGLAYTGSITAMVGDTASLLPLADGCFSLSDNFVTIYREVPDAGTVSTETGATVAYTCPGDSLPDIIRFDSLGASSSLYTYVITDTNNVILGLPAGDAADFEDAGVGTCRVWGLAYTGNITAMVGDTASTVALSDNCFDLSDNFITVYREQPDGGIVSIESGGTDTTVCVGDGLADLIRFDSTGATNSLYTYVITDTNNVILALPPADAADFEDAGGGICRVWGLAYTGTITAAVGDTASVVSLTDACFDLSDNFITVNREAINGGTVQTEEGLTTAYTCPGDSLADIVRLDSLDVLGNAFTYLITDTNNVITAILSNDSTDFEDAGIGVSRIWGLAYNGNLQAMVGDTASVAILSDDCYALSDNFITVFRDIPEGGTVSTESGDTLAGICLGIGIGDFVRMQNMGTSNSLYAYVITDTSNVIISISTSDSVSYLGLPLATTTTRIWGLSYTGNITAMPGDTASLVAFTDACFDLSDNFVLVSQEEVEGGTILTDEGEEVAYTCPGDGVADLITFESFFAFGENFSFVFTDTNNVILGFSDDGLANFEGLGEGITLVWGMAYSGTLTGMIGDTAGINELATGCYNLTSNFVTVFQEQPEGGTVVIEGGQRAITITVGDGLIDRISFDSIGVSNSRFVYLITDTMNVLVDVIQDGDTYDFENSGPGACHIWGLAYTGNLEAMVGDTITTTALSDDCFDLSDDFAVVFKEMLMPGPGLQLAAWPSPVSSTLTLQIEEERERPGKGQAWIRIIGSAGQPAAALRIDASSQQLEIDVSGLQPGIYFLQYYDGSQQRTLRFSKQ